MKSYIYILLTIFLLVSCNDKSDIDFVVYEPKIVVEGYIENEAYSSVLLSVSASMTGPKDTLNLLNHVIKSAKVTVSDGDVSEILILQTNNNKIPPYEYRGSLLRGEVGKTYSLKIEYDGKIITSTTYIPQPVALDSIWFKKAFPEDTIGYINVKFKNTSTDYYQISTCKYPNETIFTPCLYGNIDPKIYPKNADVSMQINKGPVLFPKPSYITYFKLSDETLIKFSTQTKEGYLFWTSFQNEVLNTQNPIFPANSNLVSNIEGGNAIGIWSGIGSNVYLLTHGKISE